MTFDLAERPEDVGLDGARVAALVERARREVDAGLLPSCQLAIAREGRIAAFETFGHPTGAPPRYVLFSATKGVVAGAFTILVGEGRVDPDQRVAEIVPEFATNGKDAVTVEQVLLHTAGFPLAPLGPPEWDTREGRLAVFERWRLNWEPGTAFEYHPLSAHWVLAEIIERLSGIDFRRFVHERVAAPLGMSGFRLGLPADDQGDVAHLQIVGEAATPAELEAALGVSEVPATEITPQALLLLGTPEVLTVGLPGGGGVATAADMAVYYQALLHDTGGLWEPHALAELTGVVRNELPDPVFGIPAMRTRGLMTAGTDGLSHMRGFGRTVSPRAFGHDGAGGQIAWADPDTGISFCYLTNGLDQNVVREARRTTALASLAGNCLAGVPTR
ncbi:MAG: beta-lactamase family protein [Acidimicrobiia bacterium]|nr:beta-lactamase family protein [Acidimicrobiia bacterium]